ncbi:hypothetical protein CSB20_08210 [bacterium DOLZORAL124_64_63]|nr:MAG: hypothetical protein CSB20_08210 [bacterium DOLZORAL124_64_63]
MAQIVGRMIRAAKLDPTLYAAVAWDRQAMGEAMTVMVIASVATALGMEMVGFKGLLGGASASLGGWFLSALLAYLLGITVLREPGTRATLPAVLRAGGYACAPGVIAGLGIMPYPLGAFANLAANVWWLLAFIVAIRVVMNYENNVKAVMIGILGWGVKTAFVLLLIMSGVGDIAITGL